MLVGGDMLILKSFWYKQKLKEVQKLAKTSGAFANHDVWSSCNVFYLRLYWVLVEARQRKTRPRHT